MILYKDRPLSVAQENTIMLETDDGSAFIYLSKSTYDQALLLADRFEGELSYLKKMILGDSDNNKEQVLFFFENAPEPINILAPYIGLVQVELDSNMRELCGALHMLSMSIDFNEFAKVPEEIRAEVKFTKNTIRRFEQSWKDIEVKLHVTDIDLENVSVDAVATILSKMLPALNLSGISNGQPVGRSVSDMSYEEDSDDEEKGIDDIDMSDFFEAFDDITMPSLDETKSEENVKNEEDAVIAEASMDEKEKELSEIDKLIASMVGGA